MTNIKTDKPISGIVIWAVSFCRSTVATYLTLARFLPCDVRLVVFGPKENPLRHRAGFSSAEFEESQIDLLSPADGAAVEFLEEHRHYVHMFCSYQASGVFHRLIALCIKGSIRYFVASEAPLNMERPGPKRVLKAAYLRAVLPARVREFVRHAEFIVNYSGDGNRGLSRLGWTLESIEPFGYFPPPLPGSKSRDRADHPSASFSFLMTGIHSWHRDPLTFVRALRVLRDRVGGYRFHGVICGDGPLTKEVATFVSDNQLAVEFRGFISLPQLIHEYETANAFVATGCAEPWGIRVNDAMQCGCPALVSDGMGASKLVKETGFGGIFRSRDPEALAEEMAKLVRERDKYRALLARAQPTLNWLRPETRGRSLANRIAERLGL